MQQETTHRARWAFVWLLSICVAQPGALAQYTPPGVEGTAKITGRLLQSDGKPLRGGRVLAAHLSSSKLFSSEPTGGNGEYVVSGLPYGYYDLAVETTDGLFVSNRAVNVPPAGEVAVIFTLVPFNPTTRHLERKHPGSDLEPAGVAALRRKAKGREFWRSPKGVAIISSVAGAALLAIAAGSSTETVSTNFE